MIAGVFDEFFGVPTHPLAVHAPVVLVPILAIVAIVFAARPNWRQRGWIAMPVAVFVMAVMLFVAKESGESAEAANNVFGDIADHKELGEQTFFMSIVWFVVATALGVRDRMLMRAPAQSLSADAAPVQRDPVALGLSIVAATLAIVTTIWLIRTGHAGAESRWAI